MSTRQDPGDQDSAIRVLVIDDEAKIRAVVCCALAGEGVTCTQAADGAQGLALAAAERPNLIVLDLGLPDQDGLDVCRQLRAASSVPIIVVTARSDELDRVLLLEMGADDYVVKPFGLRELVARIRAVQRRIDAAPEPREDRLEFGPLMIERAARRVWLRGSAVELTPKEFDLLVYLAEAPGVVRTRERILTSVWDEHWWGPTKTLDVHIGTLRRKLDGFDAITTLRGVGYRFDPPD